MKSKFIAVLILLSLLTSTLAIAIHLVPVKAVNEHVRVYIDPPLVSKVPGANTSSWTYTPTTDSSCAVYLNVTDSEATTAQSNIITLMEPSAGGGSRMPYKC